jgi:hypothetical protein
MARGDSGKDARSYEEKTGDGADKYRVTESARKGQTIIQDFGRDHSDEEGLTAMSMEPHNWGGSVDDLGHTIKGGKANLGRDEDPVY